MASITTVGPLMAGGAAVASLLLAVNARAQLRRRAETLRDAAGAEKEGSTAQRALLDEHRRVTGRLIARERLGVWPFVWPWLAWGGVAGSYGLWGFDVARALDRGGAVKTTFSEVFPSGGGEIVFLALFPLAMGYTTHAYSYVMVQRAHIEREFFYDGTIRRPPTLRSLVVTASAQDDNGEAPPPARPVRRRRGAIGWVSREWQSLRATLKPAVPVFAVALLGLAVGSMAYLFTRDGGAVGISTATLRLQFGSLGLGLMLVLPCAGMWLGLRRRVANARKEPERLPYTGRASEAADDSPGVDGPDAE